VSIFIKRDPSMSKIHTQHHCRVVTAPVSYSWRPGFETGSGSRLSWFRIRDFPHSLLENTCIAP